MNKQHSTPSYIILNCRKLRVKILSKSEHESYIYIREAWIIEYNFFSETM